MAVYVEDHHKHTVDVEGGTIRLQLARMTPAQYEAFNAWFTAMGKGRGNPELKPIADDESTEQALERTAAHIAYLEENARWTADTFRRFVRVVDGDLIAQENGEVITDGARFAELYVAEASSVLAELWLCNALTEAQKKTLRSVHGSVTGSTTASSLAAVGTRPETTATGAARRASAVRAAATASSSAASCGTTARSGSKPVRSSHSRPRSSTSSDSSAGATPGGSTPCPPHIGSGPRGREARRSTTRTRG